MNEVVIGGTIGGYEIQREIGRGGMGVVYRAKELALERTVALKILSEELAADPNFIAEFYKEARAAAQINHPNIVTIFAVGEANGFHYIAMEHVIGRTISSMIKRSGQLQVGPSVEIARQICKALSAAHARRIYHRDIKPHNVMLDDQGLVRVLDFGIAKVKNAEWSPVSADDTWSGTPTYMSPEQFKGLPVDQRADIYSLGVTLYHMLAGRPPYVTLDREMLMKMILESPIPYIRKFNTEVPHALVPILEKALAKKKEDRYSQASEFEEDLHRIARSLKNANSGKSGIGSSRSGDMAPRRDANEYITPHGSVIPLVGSTPPRGIVEPRPAEEAAVFNNNPQSSFKFPSVTLPRPRFLLVAVALIVFGGLFIALLRLGHDPREALRLSGHEGDIYALAISPDGKQAATAGRDMKVRLWDLSDSKVSDPKSDADSGGWLPSWLRGVESREPLATLEGHQGYIFSLGYSPDGKLLVSASGDNTLRMWDVQERKQLREFADRDLTVHAAAYSADGRWVVEGGSDRLFRIWPADSSKPAKVLKGHAEGIESVAISADGRRAASGGADKMILLWDVEGGKELHRFLGHSGAVTSLSFSPDGKRILSAGDTTIRVWEVQTGNLLRTLEGHKKAAKCAVFSSEGSRALSGGWDGEVRLWEIETGKLLFNIETGIEIQAVAFAPNSDYALCADAKGTVHAWRLAVAKPDSQ